MKFYDDNTKNVFRDFLTFRICTLHFIGLMFVNILMLANTHEFDIPYRCAFLTCMVLVFIFCPLVHVGFYWDTGENILGRQWSCMGYCGGQSWYLSSVLVVGSCNQNLDEFFIIIIIFLQWLCSHSHIQKVPLPQHLLWCVLIAHR